MYIARIINVQKIIMKTELISVYIHGQIHGLFFNLNLNKNQSRNVVVKTFALT